MLQSAIFADLQVNSFGIPAVRFAPRLPLVDWTARSFAQIAAAWVRGTDQGAPLPAGDHLRRDIGLTD